MADSEAYSIPAVLATPGRRPRTCLWVAIVASVLVLGCGAFSAFVWFLFLKPVKVGRPSATELAALLRQQDFAEEYGLEPFNEANVTVEKRTMADGSYDMSYEYSGEDVYISHEIEFEPSSSDAAIGFMVSERVMQTLYEKQKMSKTLSRDYLTWGDQSKFWVLKYEGDVNGFAYIAKKGKYTVTVHVSGIVPDKATLDLILLPKLEKTTSLRR